MLSIIYKRNILQVTKKRFFSVELKTSTR